jgi:hypothetical protein
MTTRFWIRRLFDRKPRTNCKAPARYRPAFETLEDRLAPASLTVNTLDDNTTDTSVLTLREAITLVNSGGNLSSLGLSTMPPAWVQQPNPLITGTFGTGDTITLSSSLFPDDSSTPFGPNPNPVLKLNGSELPKITAQVSIVGAQDPYNFSGSGSPPRVLTISGEEKSRVFDVGTGVRLTLTNFVIENGSTTDNGGGILAYGPPDTQSGHAPE